MVWSDMCISEDDFLNLSAGDTVHLKDLSEVIQGFEDLSEEAANFFGTDVVIAKITVDINDQWQWCFSVEGYDSMVFLPNDIEYIVKQEVPSLTFEPAADLNDLFNKE